MAVAQAGEEGEIADGLGGHADFGFGVAAFVDLDGGGDRIGTGGRGVGEEVDSRWARVTRQPHPAYGRRKIPAYEVVKDSIQIVRGCFGGCSFCSIGAHQGKIIQSRSRPSVLEEVGRVADQPDSSGIISDLGGPTANMYGMRCGSPEAQEACPTAQAASGRPSATCS